MFHRCSIKKLFAPLSNDEMEELARTITAAYYKSDTAVAQGGYFKEFKIPLTGMSDELNALEGRLRKEVARRERKYR